ncbi:hypothetical protein J2045_000198 [Peteryoungia aggregata LMG 23059]|uniref:Uncharacterized protein n=1 Tax=Peteryoungia aggregata LMG 23059 TaxID=1368425 RepID=A0ABU0G1Q5_9HYPH|nr:hypothetical protein [Peteryoungia aggregata]MDQ0419188.1 hypothetical protein [Peteryoungia aggregata LMG 23059]
MISGVNSLSSSTISLLFSATPSQYEGGNTSAANSSIEATGNTDNVFKAANAIGKIIEIVAGMGGSEAASYGMFTMEGAHRTENANGTYTLTKTGTGKGVPDDHYAATAMASWKEKAAGNGPKAEWARSYLDALEKGTIAIYDMSKMGVTSTMTERQTFNADGSMRGSSTSWNTQGMDAFLEQYTEIRDGVMYDKATGGHASISQNGTVFTYSVW